MPALRDPHPSPPGNRARRRRLDRLGLAVALILAACGLVAPARAGEGRFALLVQNESYADAEPAKVANEDAATLAASLRRSGFEVELKRNVTRQDLRASLAAFAARITPKATALFYYKGIGLQVSRLNYLIPVDAAIWSEDDVRREGSSLDALMGDLDKRGAGVKIAIVDAARPNPFERRFRMYAAGLAPPASPQGALVIFAEALGKVADPAKEPGSPFMHELVTQLDGAGDVETAFARTRESVARLSKGRELPWVSSTLVEPFRLAGAAAAEAAPSPPPSPPGAHQGEGKPLSEKPPSHVASAPPPGAPQGQSKPAAPPSPPAAGPPPPPTGASASQDRPASNPSPQIASRPPQGAPPSLPGYETPPQKPPAPKPAPGAAAPKPEAPQPLRPGSTFSDCTRCPEMTVLAPATFKMGSGTTPFDRPVHGVTLRKPFAIALSVVTRDQWALCVEEGGCARPKAEGAGDYPVVDIDWSDARRYVGFLSRKAGRTYRLPTEAEWEYAARGGTTTVFAWGDAPGAGHANCSDCGNRSGRPAIEPVRGYAKNGFGLFDMAGNVAEWLEDCWAPTYRDAPTDGSAPPAARCGMRVVRGGSFETTSAYVKPTARFRAAADTRSRSLGFRVARDVE